jgi:cytochrome P450
MDGFWATVPGSFGAPVVGQTLEFYRDYLGLLGRFHKAYGRVFKLNVVGHKSVSLLGADANRMVLADRADAFSSRLGWEFTLGELFRRGLMLRDGDDHRHHRRILQVAFQRPALSSYLEQMEPLVVHDLDGWRPQARTRVFDEMKRLLLDLAARVFLGLTLQEEIDEINAAFRRLLKGSTAFVRRPVPFLDYGRALKARTRLETFFAKAVRERRENPTPDLLGRLCTAVSEEGERLSDHEVVDHIVFFMMAAHDTTTSALTSLFYEISLAVGWQDRLREESLSVSGPLDLDKLRGLESLRWAIAETLRLHPPLVVIPRRVVAEVEFAGYRLPAGTNIAIMPAYTHRMEEYWTEPEHFDPERFSESRAEDRRVSFSYVPFGGGAHHCLGMFFAEIQAKLVAHHLLRRFRLGVEPGYSAPYRQVPIQAPRDGLPLRLERV